jgi:hypothetical protein
MNESAHDILRLPFEISEIETFSSRSFGVKPLLVPLCPKLRVKLKNKIVTSNRAVMTYVLIKFILRELAL